MNNENESSPSGAEEAWRAFGSDTEAGRLLKKLYCGNAKPVINYPKVKTKKQQSSSPFIPGGGTNSDARTNHLASSNTARAVKVPTLGNQSTHNVSAIDVAVAHRRSKVVIEKEMNQIKQSIEGYRPSVASYPGSEAEKQKLQQRFTYAPGTILPQEILPGADILDKELAHRDVKREGGGPQSTANQLVALKKQVIKDIEERKRYIAEMAALGKNANSGQMQHDIDQLLNELKQINAMLNKQT